MYLFGSGAAPATGTLSWLPWLFVVAMKCWAGKLLVPCGLLLCAQNLRNLELGRSVFASLFLLPFQV